MKKIVYLFVLLFIGTIGIIGISFANNNIFNGMEDNYIFFYANACPHCQKVETFFSDNNLIEKYNIKKIEVRENKENMDFFKDYLEKLKLGEDELSVPFLVIDTTGFCNYIHGSTNIINYFQTLLGLQKTQGSGGFCITGQEVCSQLICDEHTLLSNSKNKDKDDLGKKISFFGIMLPAAFADSINPCAFAVILLLLSAILSKEKNRRKAVFAGLLFVIAVFISYFAMGLGLFSALANTSNTFILKIIVGILGIVVGLANLKDFFWYGKGFIMEVPLSWRPKMKNIIEKVVSPVGAFLIGLVVSMFLLPCTSGPYFTILGYLASENSSLNLRGIIYLFVYNLIFILPMLIIVLLVGSGWKTAEEISNLRNKNKKVIHLIVGILMLGLGIYVLGDIFMWWI